MTDQGIGAMNELAPKVGSVTSQRKKPALCIMALAVSIPLVALAASSNHYLEQRRQFRDEVKNKVEKKLDPDGKYGSVIFANEQGKYNFGVTPDDRKRLKAHVREYFSCADEALLEKMIEELDTGHYVLFKQYRDDGVNTKVISLSPRAQYWQWLTDANGIETMFHAFNFSVGLYAPDERSQYTVIQSEGSFFGITQSANQPLFCRKDPEERTFTCEEPAQAEMIAAMAKMPPVVPGREKPEQKFMDACRTHPYFQEKDNHGEFVIKDENLLKIYDEVVTHKDEKCPVKATLSRWRIHEDYPYWVADYSLKTTVNIAAVVPRSLRFLEGIVQIILNEVSVKYIPLSMKNFRDYSQEWTKTGGPESHDSRVP